MEKKRKMPAFLEHGVHHVAKMADIWVVLYGKLLGNCPS